VLRLAPNICRGNRKGIPLETKCKNGAYLLVRIEGNIDDKSKGFSKAIYRGDWGMAQRMAARTPKRRPRHSAGPTKVRAQRHKASDSDGAFYDRANEAEGHNSDEYHRTCEICDGSDTTLLASYTVSKWPVVSCDDCGFVFLSRVPNYDLLNIEYAWEKTFAIERQRRTQRVWGVFDQLTRIRTTVGKLIDNASQGRSLGTTGRVLEIGCGGGTRVASGPTPYGIEISKALAHKADPIFAARGGRVIHAPAAEGLTQFPDSYFDTVLMRSYLEHEAQPRLVLKEARRTLKTGGTVYVRVPNYGSVNRRVMGSRWCGFRFPDHVNYFTPKHLKRLAASCGFTYRRINWYSPFDDNLIVELIACN